MYTLEEEEYFKNIIVTFDTAWKSVSFGPEIMDFYIGFCKKNKGIAFKLFPTKPQCMEVINNLCFNKERLTKLSHLH